jgi:hypothetical protein
MVLMRALLPLLLLLGCAAREAAPVAATGRSVAVLALHEGLADDAVEVAPDAFADALERAAAARGLSVLPVADAGALDPLRQHRTSAHRLAWMAGQPGDAELLLLVAAQARFFSQMSGRYRWTVEVQASVASRAEPGRAEDLRFQVPVFLEYDREREDAALAAAAPVVERRLGVLLDQWLGGAAAP